MDNKFIHPDMNVNGSAAAQKGYSMASKYLKSAGVDTTSLDIGQRLASGDVEGGVESAVTNITGNQTVGTIAGTLASVVMAVLGGQNVGQQEINAAAKNASAVKDITQSQNQLSNLSEKGASEIKNETEANIDAGKQNIDGKTADTQAAVESSKEVVDGIKAKNEEQQAKIAENNKAIQEATEKRNAILEKINSKQASSKTLQNEQTNVKNDKNGEQKPQISSLPEGGSEDPELQALKAKYDSLGGTIEKLIADNNALNTKLAEGNKTIQDNVNETVSVTETQLSEIDECANNIISMSKDAQGAINEISEMLQGQFKTLDKQTCVKLACEMVKATANGTQSGLLAAAATAMGVSSLFSFGATAAKTAQLTKNSVECGTASASEIAANVAGKAMQDYAKNLSNQIVGNITQGLGELAGLDANTIAEITSGIQQLQNDVIQPYMEENNVQSDKGDSRTSGQSDSSGEAQTGGQSGSTGETQVKKQTPNTPQTAMA